MSVIWFASQQHKAHAFRTTAAGILHYESLCTKVSVERCEDLPAEDDVFKCFTCMRLVRKEKNDADK